MFSSRPLECFDHFNDVCAEVLINRSERVRIRRAVAVNRSPEEMADGVCYKKLAGRGGISLEIKEHSVHVRFGMGIILLGYSIGERGIAVHKLQGIVGQFAKVIPDGFVGAMDGSVYGRIKEIDPIWFVHVCTWLYDSIL